MKHFFENKFYLKPKTFALLLFILPLLVAMGSGLLLVEKTYVVVAVIGIVLSGSAFLMGVMAHFYHSHPYSDPSTGVVIGILGVAVSGLICACLVFILRYCVIQPWIDLEHYRRVADHPITVTATVTHHSSYQDSDDGIHYRSYITYTYDDVCYENCPYENVTEKEKRSPIGKIVSLQISPEDPQQQVEDLKGRSWLVCVLSPLLLAGLAVLCMLVQRTQRSQKDGSLPDRQTVQDDVKVEVRSRMLRPFLLFGWLFYGFLYGRYGMVFGWIPLAIAGVCFVGWLWCMYTTIRDYRYAQNELFELREDVLVGKEDKSDSEGSCYILHYRSGSRTWQATVNDKEFFRAKEGDRVLAVYLPKKGKPILHYDGKQG